MNVTAIKESDWNKDGTVVKVTNVTFDDGTEAPGYDLPSVPEVGKPLPQGWEVATGKSGKRYIKVPKPGGGGFGGGAAAFRNTKEGAIAEQRSIHASVAVTQAVAWYQQPDVPPDTGGMLILARNIFEFLQTSSGSTGAIPPGTDNAPIAGAPRSNTPAGVTPAGTAGKGSGSLKEGQAYGEGAAPSDEVSPAPCQHSNVTLLNPKGAPLPHGFWRCADCGETGRDKL